MDWYEITIKTNKEDLDKVTEILLEQGCGGVSVDDPDEVNSRLQNPLPTDYLGEDLVEFVPVEYAVKAYFSIDSDISAIKSCLSDRINVECNKQNEIIIKVANDKNWDSWKEYFKPFKLIEGITVVPSWETYIPSEGEKTILMDPGMAFGTGTHETTKLCAYLIDKYVSECQSFLDLGAGTGILSIIAHIKGISDIVAVDIDDAAVRAAKENFMLNDTLDIKVVKGTVSAVQHRKFGMIAANILAEVLIDISQQIGNIIKYPGFVVLSGIIKKKENDVRTAYEENGFYHIETKYENDWVAMIFKCRDFI